MKVVHLTGKIVYFQKKHLFLGYEANEMRFDEESYIRITLRFFELKQLLN